MTQWNYINAENQNEECRFLNNLNLRQRNSLQRVAMLWWWNCGSRSEGWILEIQGLAPVDGRETGAIDDHIAGRCDKVTVVLLRTRHPETFIRCEQRALHFVHGGRNLTPQAASGPGDLLFDNRRLTGQL